MPTLIYRTLYNYRSINWNGSIKKKIVEKNGRRIFRKKKKKSVELMHR